MIVTVVVHQYNDVQVVCDTLQVLGERMLHFISPCRAYLARGHLRRDVLYFFWCVQTWALTCGKMKVQVNFRLKFF